METVREGGSWGLHQGSWPLALTRWTTPKKPRQVTHLRWVLAEEHSPDPERSLQDLFGVDPGAAWALVRGPRGGGRGRPGLPPPGQGPRGPERSPFPWGPALCQELGAMLLGWRLGLF